MPRWPPMRPWCRPTSRGNLLLEGGVQARRGRRSLRDLRRGGRGRVRDRLRRARLYRARGRLGRARRRSHRDPCLDPDALHGPRRGRDRHAAAARGGAHRADGLRRRLRRQARSLGPAAGRAGGVEARPAGRAASTRGRKAWRPSTKRHPARIAAQLRLRCRGQAAGLRGARRTSTPAPMPRGGRPSPTACRCTPWVPTACPTCAPGATPASPTARRPAPSAASACRRPPSPTRR